MVKEMKFENLTQEDKIALAETYRVYELLEDTEKERIPEEFVEMIFNYGDLSLVPPLDSEKKLIDFNLSKQGKYLVMYMCTLYE